MKKEKLSLKGIKNVLSRIEMKRIMAGSGGTCATYGQQCGSNIPGASYPPCCDGLICVGSPSGESATCV
jgi:hypothetical protein